MEDSLKFKKGFYNEASETCNICFEKWVVIHEDELSKEFNTQHPKEINNLEYQGILACPECGFYDLNYQEEEEY